MRSCPVCDYEYEDSFGGCPRHEAESDIDTLGGMSSRRIERDPMVGTNIADRYAVTHMLGRGAMGVVYKATQLSDGKDVAIKILHGHLATEPESIKRFHAEAQAARSLMHANIVRIYDVGVIQTGAPYIAMELLDGKTLSDFLKERQYLSTNEALPIIRQTCEALAEAHSRGVLHRDIKPANIMLLNRFGQENFVMVLDFSIAKVIQKVSDVDSTAPGLIFGSPAYMSPERFMGRGGDFRSDIYAMGIIMFQMIAGRIPFKSGDLYTLMNEHINTAPPSVKQIRPDADIPDILEETIARALSKKPEDRQENMKQLLAEINEVYRSGSQSRDVYQAPAALPPDMVPAEMQFANSAPAFGNSGAHTVVQASGSYSRAQDSAAVFDINAGRNPSLGSVPTYQSQPRKSGLDEQFRTKIPEGLNASGRWDKSLINGTQNTSNERPRPVIRHKESSSKSQFRLLALIIVVLLGAAVFMTNISRSTANKGQAPQAMPAAPERLSQPIDSAGIKKEEQSP